MIQRDVIVVNFFGQASKQCKLSVKFGTAAYFIDIETLPDNEPIEIELTARQTAQEERLEIEVNDQVCVPLFNSIGEIKLTVLVGELRVEPHSKIIALSRRET